MLDPDDQMEDGSEFSGSDLSSAASNNTSSSSSSSSDSDNSSESAGPDIDENIEIARILKNNFELPKGLCENSDIFNEFFSLKTWNNLPEPVKNHLMNNFLPKFPENDKYNKALAIQKLFNREEFRFGTTPLVDFGNNLQEGNYRPEISKLRASIAKSKRREKRFQECERISRMAKSIMLSREKLLRAAYDAPPGTVLRVEKTFQTTPKFSCLPAAARAKKRYFQDINFISKEIGIEGPLSEDENYPEGPPAQLSRKQRRHLSGIQGGAVSPGAESRILSTMSIRGGSLDHLVGPGGTAPLSEEFYRQILSQHKKRKIDDPDHPELDTSDILLKDVHTRTQLSAGHRRPLPHSKLINGTAAVSNNKKIIPQIVKQEPPVVSQPVIVKPTNQFQQQLNRSQSLLMVGNTQNCLSNSESDEESQISIKLENHSPERQSTPIITKTEISEQIPIVHETTTGTINLANYSGKVKPATFSDLEGIDMMHLPVDLDESGSIDILNEISDENDRTPELMQETHACFLSLIRDIFCSTPDHRTSIDNLQKKLTIWIGNPITPLNDWYSLADNWLNLLASAVYFLCGEFIDQPEDFVPYLEYKPNLQLYQWIGAGRDTDQHLIQLCSYWLSRRNDMGSKTSSSTLDSCKYKNANSSTELEDDMPMERPISPPPPRYPTNWMVTKASMDEIEDFREQEKVRFDNPHLAFTYQMHGYESVVGPVKGIYTQVPGVTKPRGHNMLVTERPNFVTILTLVRDATARLPNGEGTRAEICELLKSSQYINPAAPDTVLQTIVSGALDRMHTEHDPCVRYDGKKKIWIYLHRNRGKDEFEKLHQQYQGMGKHKKPINRKIKTKSTKIIKSPQKLEQQQSIVVVQKPIEPQMPALSSIQNNNNSVIQSIQSIQTTIPTISTTTTQPPPLNKITNHLINKPLIKHEFVPIKSEKLENIDVEASIDAHATPVLIKNMPGLIIDKSPKLLTPTTPIRIQTPIQQQTTPKSILSNSNQSILVQNRSQSPMITPQKKLTTKPVLISTNQAPPLVQQSSITGQSYLYPVNITTTANHQNSSPKLIKTTTTNLQQPPGLTSTKSPKISLLQSQQKNLKPIQQISGKSLINPAIIQQQQQQKMIVKQQQLQKSTIPTTKPFLQLITQQRQNSIVVTGNQQQQQQVKSIIISPHQQQQQIQTSVSSSVIQTQKLTNVIGTSTNSQLIQPITYQQSGKVQTISTASLTPQQQQNILQSIKQQHQLKNQMQQQQQQQQHQQVPVQQQSLILKQQHFVQKNQLTQKTMPTKPGASLLTTNSNLSNVTVSMPNTSTGTTTIINPLQQQHPHHQQQQQTITRVIKPGGGVVGGLGTITNSPQNITAIGSRIKPNTVNQQMTAKVLTNSSGQIISLESLLKHGIAPGTTLRVAGTKPGQTSLIQLAGTSGSQITQYAVVSQGRNINLVAAPQRVVSSTTAATGPVSMSLIKTTDTKPVQTSTTTVTNSAPTNVIIASPHQNQPKIIQQTSLNQQFTAQQLENAKFIGLQGLTGTKMKPGTGIRMVNASNLNLAHIGGKPVIITSKPTSGQVQQPGQSVIIQAGQSNGTNFVIGGQTLKMQGNVMQNILNQNNSGQTQTVMVGNQLVKVQSQQQNSGQINSVSVNSSSVNTVIPNTTTKTVMLGSSGQTIKLQQSGGMTQSQQVILGTTNKGNMKVASTSNQQRVVLAVQGGGQILLPPGFQGGAINLKTLQGLKVIPFQQANKGSNDERQVYAQIISSPQVTRTTQNSGSDGNVRNKE